MNKRFYPVAALTIVAVVVALGGYLMPQSSEAVPVRVLLDNSAGAVVFNHQRHVEEAGVSCETCHHESQTPREEVVPCKTCHGAVFDEAFRTGHAAAIQDVQACVTCHHMEFAPEKGWDHDAHAELLNGDCLSCHHDPEIEPEPQNCANCHGSSAEPPLKEAAHTRCQSCHEPYFEEGMQGCASCHLEVPSREKLEATGTFTVNPAYASCSVCHTEKPEELVLGPMDAFHKSCMGCHEQEDKGPYTKEQCNQCHQK